MFFRKVTVVVFTLLFAVNIYASEWHVDSSHSQVNFISVKKINIAEVHQFEDVQGSLNSDGLFSLNIDLTSVNTHNAVRDERMKKFFFNTEQFSTATLNAEISPSILDSIAEGANTYVNIDAVLKLHGESKPLKLDVIITRLVGAKLLVVSAKPVILNVNDFSLISGVNKLMELAKLPSISHAVPVSFNLMLKLAH